MGSIFSLFYSDNNTKKTDPKYQQGVGNSANNAAVQKSSPVNGNTKQKKKYNTVGAQRKKPKGKINKDMIGKPGNFQHTAHVGARDMRGDVDLNKLKQQITGPIMPLSMSAPTQGTPSPLSETQGSNTEVSPTTATATTSVLVNS